MPSFEELENPESSLASEIYSDDGVLLGTYYIENRSNTDYQRLPQHLIDALLATEDIRFHKHAGVDGKALMRVFYGLITNNYSGGGSTITQQLAKNLFPRKENITKPELALRKLKDGIPNLMLLDVVLPNFNGWEILRKIKQDPKLKQIMVVILSNLGEKEEVEKGIKLGAEKYLVKAHYTPSEVIEEVKKILN